MGILKLDKTSPDDKIVYELQKMVAYDPYIIIAEVKRSVKKINELPYNGKVGAYLESGFSAPVRDKAMKQLQAWGISVDIDQNKLCHDGIMMLAKLYKNANQRLRGEIIESLKMFSPDTLPMETLLALDKSKIPEEYVKIIDEFRNELILEK